MCITPGAALDRVAAAASQRRAALSVLIDLAVDAISHHLSHQPDGRAGSQHMLLPGHVVDVDAAADIADIRAFATTKGQSLDLIVCLASAASRSFRRATLVDPFPQCFLAADGGEDLDLFSKALSCIPPISTLSTEGNPSCGAAARSTGQNLQGDAAVLLRWLIDLKGVHVQPDSASGSKHLPLRLTSQCRTACFEPCAECCCQI